MDAIAKKRLGEGVYGASKFRHVYADSQQRFSNQFGSRNPISYGDRLFARIIRKGRVLLEVVINEVCDLTEFLGELRKKATGIKGLVELYVRNYTRGWSLQQPLMLYGCNTFSYSAPKPARKADGERMLFPWETH